MKADADLAVVVGLAVVLDPDLGLVPEIRDAVAVPVPIDVGPAQIAIGTIISFL